MITLTRTYTPEYPPLADGYKWVFCNIEINGETYGFRTNCREELTDEEVQVWLTVKHDDFACEIYRYMYQGAIVTPNPGETLLDAWQRWVNDGCKNTATVIEDGKEETVETVIEKRAWNDTH